MDIRLITYVLELETSFMDQPWIPFHNFTFFLQLSSQYELWAEQLQNGELPRGKLKDAEVQLRNLSDHVNHIQASTYEVAQRGQDLLQVRQSFIVTDIFIVFSFIPNA